MHFCEHSLVTGFVDHEPPIQPKTVEDVAHEFQLDEVEPIASPGGAKVDTDVYNSEAFLQNLGEALPASASAPPHANANSSTTAQSTA